jgi:propionyl-CoA carboxylase alpha chain
MFAKILIANRGEIAARIMRTARRLGIKTVAVYSEADRGALHVRAADEAVPIGPAPSAESYLSLDALIKAVTATGAEAVHPGYGFLAENPAFARALAEAGVAFIGPGTDAIALMGDKIESKRLASEAGLGAIPGHSGVIASAEEAVEVARAIGYPVMVKASAGGGGKGMRIARDDAEARDGYSLARSEARSSFGDDRIFIEKCIEKPRHIEIQVLGDDFGNVVYLGERECSIQRRHQKVIEEAPSPFLDAKTRNAMGAEAVALAKAVGYVSAGTVEFIVDPDRNFYFLEMNTRLQVEHPVTELVTGIDLVEQMIRIAAGEKLSFTQDDIAIRGHAIECRVYAEDPVRGFVPSPGRLVRLHPPQSDGTVRLDTGVEEGDEIPIFYDPMIAKLCTFGETRADAIGAMGRALDRYYLKGVKNNLNFLAAIMAHPRFAKAETTTGFIDEVFPQGFAPDVASPETTRRLVAVAALIHARVVERQSWISGRIAEPADGSEKEWLVGIPDGEHRVMVAPDGAFTEVAVDGRPVPVASEWRPGDVIFEGTVDGEHISVQVTRRIEGYGLSQGGARLNVVLRSPRAAELAALMPVKAQADMSRYLRSPMPGLVVSIIVEEGQEVKAGEPLAVVDAMKMENMLRAERDGRIAKICAAKGDSLAQEQVILEFE